MRRKLVSVTCAALVGPLLQAAAYAAPPNSSPTPQTRTYVSGTGSDNNACTVSAPCKTFQAALALTVAGGEIYVLNSANYGSVTINKSVSITSEGAVAGVLATSGTAIAISAGPNDVINLRGLVIDGGNSGTVGIHFTSGQSLNVQKTTVRNFSNVGVSFTPTMSSTISASELTVTGNKNNGILISTAATSSPVSGVLSKIMSTKNGVGILVNGLTANVTITDSVSSNNDYGIGGGGSAVMVRNSTLSSNAIGLTADQSAIVRIGQSTITANGTGSTATNGGLVQSYGNNNIVGNTSNGTLTSTLTLQ
jgi:hypothetical protein